MAQAKRRPSGAPKAKAKIAVFVEAYVANGGNGAKAAIEAGYSRKRARITASELLADRNISERIAARRKEVFEHAQRVTLLTAEEVLQDLAQAKRFDPAKLYGPDGSLLPVREMPEEVRLHLEGVEVDEITVGTGAKKQVVGRTAKVKFPKKSIAREQAMKHFGLYEKDNAQKPPPSNVQITVIGVRAPRR